MLRDIVEKIAAMTGREYTWVDLGENYPNGNFHFESTQFGNQTVDVNVYQDYTIVLDSERNLITIKHGEPNNIFNIICEFLK